MDARGGAGSTYWNHNTAFHPELVRSAVGRRVLDVGCGDGLLLERMHGTGASLTGVDTDPAALASARARLGTAATLLECGIEDDRLAAGGYDLVTVVAVLHHLSLRPALVRLADLVAPGGELVVIGLARSSRRRDVLADAVTVPIARIAGRLLREGGPGLVVREPEESYAEVRSTARGLLPGMRYRRRLFYRYSLRWARPGAPS